MAKHLITLLTTLLFTTVSYAHATELHSYQQIKDALISGASVHAVINEKTDCTLTGQTGDEPKTTANVVGLKLDPFVISETTGNISVGITPLNSPREGFPANYNDFEVKITPDNKVYLQFKIVSLPDYKIIKSSDHVCEINNNNQAGIRFYSKKRLIVQQTWVVGLKKQSPTSFHVTLPSQEDNWLRMLKANLA